VYTGIYLVIAHTQIISEKIKKAKKSTFIHHFLAFVWIYHLPTDAKCAGRYLNSITKCSSDLLTYNI
jgi:hypothetical protein